MQIRCPGCGHEYRDIIHGLLASWDALAAHRRGPLAIGCTGCGHLFVLETPTVDSGATGPEVGPVQRYQILKLIGRGGMGETFVARDFVGGREVCLKLLLPGLDDRVIRQEWRALARLDHPNIVKFHEAIELNGRTALVMEYVAGRSLADCLASCGLFSPELALDLTLQLGDALTCLHGHEIIHCDLKPANVLVQQVGARLNVKVVDLGLAVVDRRDDRDVITGAGRVAGTPPYMAPEQFEGKILTPACDVYALALILAEMLTGHRPFVGPGIEGQKLQLRDGLSLPPAVEEGVARVIREATRADELRRPGLPELLTDLRRLVRPVSPPAVVGPVNLGFDEPWENGVPPGWSNSERFVDGVSTDFRFAPVVRGGADDGLCVQIEPAACDSGAFGSLMQRFPATHLADRRVRLVGDLKTSLTSGWAGLWLRADGPARSLLFDNMHERPIQGTTPWRRYAIERTVPPGTTWMNVGVIHAGEGIVWADRFDLEYEIEPGRWGRLSLGSEARPGTVSTFLRT
ncbi:MAG: serine/threonine protein kinase [Candidatus Riflebacteria bacterium]|nr:serine/threonine protein kinase [Candidatus Riflebacteria bacterium]